MLLLSISVLIFRQPLEEMLDIALRPHAPKRRLQFCPAEVQRKWFEQQFDLARDSGLPVFLHMRAAAADLLRIVRAKHGSHFTRGVIHSFDGSLQEAQSILSLQGLSIGNLFCMPTSYTLEEVVLDAWHCQRLGSVCSCCADCRPHQALFHDTQASTAAR